MTAWRFFSKPSDKEEAKQDLLEMVLTEVYKNEKELAKQLKKGI